MSDLNRTIAQKAIGAVKADVVPQSPEHWARIVLGGSAVGVSCFKYAVHQGAWGRDDLIAAALFLLGGLGVVFTKSVVALLSSVPVPWRKSAP